MESICVMPFGRRVRAMSRIPRSAACAARKRKSIDCAFSLFRACQSTVRKFRDRSSKKERRDNLPSWWLRESVIMKTRCMMRSFKVKVVSGEFSCAIDCCFMREREVVVFRVEVWRWHRHFDVDAWHLALVHFRCANCALTSPHHPTSYAACSRKDSSNCVWREISDSETDLDNFVRTPDVFGHAKAEGLSIFQIKRLSPSRETVGSTQKRNI